jgi:3-hydroxyacyl-[acyl-carrier protein] dehydratase/trans-2-decenoyl-[acyl-carrier protein] isomerase
MPSLPLPPMLMFDRITDDLGRPAARTARAGRAEFDIKPDLWFFPCHFKGDPVMPGCLGLDALWQLTGFFLGWLGLKARPRARRRRGEIHRQVLPTVKKVVYGVDFKRVFLASWCSASPTAGSKATAKRSIEVKDMKVGLFQPDA